MQIWKSTTDFLKETAYIGAVIAGGIGGLAAGRLGSYKIMNWIPKDEQTSPYAQTIREIEETQKKMEERSSSYAIIKKGYEEQIAWERQHPERSYAKKIQSLEKGLQENERSSLYDGLLFKLQIGSLKQSLPKQSKEGDGLGLGGLLLGGVASIMATTMTVTIGGCMGMVMGGKFR